MEAAKNSFCEYDTANTEMIFCAENVMKINKIINDYFAYYSNLDLLRKQSWKNLTTLSHWTALQKNTIVLLIYCPFDFEFEKHTYLSNDMCIEKNTKCCFYVTYYFIYVVLHLFQRNLTAKSRWLGKKMQLQDQTRSVQILFVFATGLGKFGRSYCDVYGILKSYITHKLQRSLISAQLVSLFLIIVIFQLFYVVSINLFQIMQGNTICHTSFNSIIVIYQ